MKFRLFFRGARTHDSWARDSHAIHSPTEVRVSTRLEKSWNFKEISEKLWNLKGIFEKLTTIKVPFGSGLRLRISSLGFSLVEEEKKQWLFCIFLMPTLYRFDTDWPVRNNYENFRSSLYQKWWNLRSRGIVLHGKMNKNRWKNAYFFFRCTLFKSGKYVEKLEDNFQLFC